MGSILMKENFILLLREAQKNLLFNLLLYLKNGKKNKKNNYIVKKSQMLIELQKALLILLYSLHMVKKEEM